MPFIKTKNIHVTPNRSVRYICDPVKTQNGLNVVSVNCMPDARNAYLDMKQVYEYYSNRKFNEPMPKSGKAKVKLIHYIQSFDPKDNVSVETAQKIGLDLVKEMFGENVQAVIATHDDTGKIHNHIMLNVYDLKGNHFSSDKASFNKIKKPSDEICKRYGVETFDCVKYVRQSVIFAEQFQAVGIKTWQAAGAYKGTSTFSHISEKYLQIYQIITQEKIGSIDALQRKFASAEKKYADLTQRVQELKERIETTTEEIKLAEHYFNDMGVMQRRFPKKDEDKAAVAIVKQHSFKKKEDISVLLEQLEKYQTELAELNEQLSSAGGEVRKYKALAIIRIDKIDSIETAHILSGRMKISAANANDFTKRASFLRRSRDYNDLIETVRNIDIYPPEKKLSEEKKNPPKKKRRR